GMCVAFDGFGDILKPEGKGLGGPMGGTIPQAAPVPQPSTQPQKLISGDLDMSLSSLVENLNIKGPSQNLLLNIISRISCEIFIIVIVVFIFFRQQWNSPKTQSKTGGTGWAPAISTGTTGYRPPQGAMPTGTNPPWQGGAPPVVNQGFPQQPQDGYDGRGSPASADWYSFSTSKSTSNGRGCPRYKNYCSFRSISWALNMGKIIYSGSRDTQIFIIIIIINYYYYFIIIINY
ncbi:hypothetical protein Avbf_18942, partial [Armadillidium vulgare]